MLERIDEYDFEDNPTAVRDLILHPGMGRVREIEMEQGRMLCTWVLAVGKPGRVETSIAVAVSMEERSELQCGAAALFSLESIITTLRTLRPAGPDNLVLHKRLAPDGGTSYLILNERVAEVEFRKTAPGRCHGTLRMEMDPRYWGREEHIRIPQCRQYLLALWREHILDAWDRHLEERAPAHPRPQPADLRGHYHVPATAPLLARWKKAYRLMVELQREYHEQLDLADQQPPTLDDFRERLSQKMGWRPSAKTVSRILGAGRAGML